MDNAQKTDNFKENYFINSLARGMQVLSAFTQERSKLSVTELSGITELPQSTIFRLVYTLEHLGYLVRDKNSRRYQQGTSMLSIGLSVRENLNIRTIALPYVEALSQHVNESAKIAILQASEIMMVIVIEAPNKLSLRTPIGHRSPAYCTALGKTLLAFQPDDTRAALLDQIEFTAHTENTITTKQALEADLQETRAQGYARIEEEFVLGMNSLAAPIFDDSGHVGAAVNLSGLLTTHMNAEIEAPLIEAVLECAAQISTALGYRDN